jgi:hypothetical protein
VFTGFSVSYRRSGGSASLWDNPRPIRSERISVDALRLARHAVAQMGLTGIEATPVARGKRTKIAIVTIAEMKDKVGVRYYWFKRPTEAAKVLAEFFAMEKRASKVDGGQSVDATPDAVESVIWQGVDLLGFRYRVVTNDQIAAHVADVRKEIDRQLVRFQTAGGLATLNQEYKALRARPRTEGEKAMPTYKVWMTKQLESRVLQLIPSMTA